MQRPYRCCSEECSTDPAGRLIFDFWAETGVCPKCGGTEADGIVQALEIIHFDPPKSKRRGHGHRACNPKKAIFGGHATGHPSVVNCPHCKATAAWKKVMAEFMGLDEPEAPVDAPVVVAPPVQIAQEVV